jgi:phage shock protein C
MAAKKSTGGKSPKKAKSAKGGHKKAPNDTGVLEKRLEHFAEEVGALGERFGRRVESKEEQWDSWFHRTFGLVGPLISSIFGIIMVGLLIWALRFMNVLIGATFLSSIEVFLFTNMGLFFLMFMFFSYASYLSKVSGYYRPLSPLVTAAGITIAFWVCSEVLAIANLSLGIMFFTSVTLFIQHNLAWIFVLFLVMAYAGYVIFSVIPCRNTPCGIRGTEMPRKGTVSSAAITQKGTGRPYAGNTKRLYRSGSDKILGGVCGGIAEYLGVDPVIIRLLWIIGTLVWGAGIIAYIIAWIIVPRNPKHKWND